MKIYNVACSCLERNTSAYHMEKWEQNFVACRRVKSRRMADQESSRAAGACGCGEYKSTKGALTGRGLSCARVAVGIFIVRLLGRNSFTMNILAAMKEK